LIQEWFVAPIEHEHWKSWRSALNNQFDWSPETLKAEGRPRIPDFDPLLGALVREHGPTGRPDIAPQLSKQRE
jgi:hypothetical protein